MLQRNQYKMMAVTLGLVLFMIFSLIVVGCTQEEATDEVGSDQEEAINVDDFPNRTITIVVPWPAGGRSDTYARGLAPLLEEELGVPVIVSNHPGASSVMGARAVLNAGSDGYTLLSLSSGSNAYKITREPPLDVDRFRIVCSYVYEPYYHVVKADSQFQSWQDLIDHAKENPGDIKFGTGGVGIDDDLIIREIMDRVGVEFTLVPYWGDAPVIVDVLAGELDAGYGVMSPIYPHLEAGNLKLIAIGSAERNPDFPDVPTFNELGFDLVWEYFGTIAAPEGTPDEVLDILSDAFEKAVNSPEFQDMMNGLKTNGEFWDREKAQAEFDKAAEWQMEFARKHGLSLE